MSLGALKVEPTGWQYADASSFSPSSPSGKELEWNGCKHFPTEIHWELRDAGKIPDWNKGRAEHEVQWVSQRAWAFRGTISLSAEQLKRGNAELEFEGLDTFATVYLNGKEVLEADNHFRAWRVPLPVKDLKETNELLLVFQPPGPIAEEISKEYGPFRGGSCNLGNRARMGIRKSQYHFRWDWGPELMCIGPDRPITLHLFDSRITHVQPHALVDEKLKASLAVEVETKGDVGGVKYTLVDAKGGVVKTEEKKGGDVSWDGLDVELWWPIGYGYQTLYDLKVELLGKVSSTLPYQPSWRPAELRDGAVVDTTTRKIGFRRIRLIQDPLEGHEGSTFLFEVNNQRIFISGSNWIPIDMVLPSATPEKYRKWLELLVRGNQNMIRVWGGGVYEPDVFYDLCDELGILVWQDFQFACGVYPIFPKFLESVTQEAKDNVRRLAHHASLAAMCGNNEDYQMIKQWNFDENAEDPLPARKIYEHILPEIVEQVTRGEVPYWRGSPYGGKGWDTADPTVGDVHQWNVWAGKEFNYQDYDILGGRFVSEFGMPGMPDRRTVDYWLDGDQSQAFIQSKLMQQHNKAGSHERRFAIAMNENFRITGDLEEYIFRNRLMQSEAVGSAYTVWRREWRGRGKELCSGVLVWQLNDCWPVTSWAIVDYFYRPKPVYFSIARASAPISLGIMRTVTKNRENDRPRQFYEYGAFQSREVKVEIWGCNAGKPLQLELQVSAVDITSGWRHDLPPQTITLGENASTELWSGACPQPSADQAHDASAPSGTVVLQARLVDSSGRVVARMSDWPQPYKFLPIPSPGISLRVNGTSVTISADRPAKGVWLDVSGDDRDLVWSDNNLDVFPGDPQTITVTRSGRHVPAAEVYATCLGYEKQRVLASATA